MDIFSIKEPKNPAKLAAEIDNRYHDKITAGSNNYMKCSYAFSDKTRIDIYKSGALVFTGRPNDYYEFRELDMRWNTEKAEAIAGAPTVCSLNFERAIIGSDETGKGEIFKPLIVAAAYTDGAEDILKYIRKCVDDSKVIQNKDKICAIGRELTGITSWEEVKDTAFLEGDTYAVRIVSNEEYNRKCHENNDNGENVQHALLKEAHAQVLKSLYEKHPDSTLVVDDFTDGRGVAAFKARMAKEAKGLSPEKIFMTTKGDSKLMAISAASIISYYLSELAYRYAQEMLNTVYKKENEPTIKLHAGSPGQKEVVTFLGKLKPEKKEEFMRTFSKMYYKNVWDAMKE